MQEYSARARHGRLRLLQERIFGKGRLSAYGLAAPLAASRLSAFGDCAPQTISHLFAQLRRECDIFPGQRHNVVWRCVMTYRCVATSVAGFVQQLAVGYITHGYYFHVSGWVPDHKYPPSTDAKIIAQYGLDLSRWARCRRRKQGQASVQYLRYGRFFVIVATHGEHPFFGAEAGAVRDFRVNPIYFMGYSIGCRQARGGGAYHASVRLERTLCQQLKQRFSAAALRLLLPDLIVQFQRLPYEPYAPVRDQLRTILRSVNRQRRVAGLELVPADALPRHRRPVRPFE
jgi:hypothetical protein